MRQEKLQTGESEVDNLYRLASLGGHRIVKLVLSVTTASVHEIVGFEMLADASFSDPTQVNSQIEVGTVGGRLRFYPDDREFAWGYVPLTENNLNLLAAQIRSGKYRIVDNDVAEMARELARKKGWSDVAVKMRSESVRVTAREQDAIERAEKAEKKAALLEQKIILEKEAIDAIASEKIAQADRVIENASIGLPEPDADKKGKGTKTKTK